MATALINGATLHYEVMGHGPDFALTSGGGRVGGAHLRPLASRLAERYRVLTYDRRNVGASDVSFAGEGSELELCMEDLHELLRQLDMAQAAVGSSS